MQFFVINVRARRMFYMKMETEVAGEKKNVDILSFRKTTLKLLHKLIDTYINTDMP